MREKLRKDKQIGARVSRPAGTHAVQSYGHSSDELFSETRAILWFGKHGPQNQLVCRTHYSITWNCVLTITKGPSWTSSPRLDLAGHTAGALIAKRWYLVKCTFLFWRKSFVLQQVLPSSRRLNSLLQGGAQRRPRKKGEHARCQYLLPTSWLSFVHPVLL